MTEISRQMVKAFQKKYREFWHGSWPDSETSRELLAAALSSLSAPVEAGTGKHLPECGADREGKMVMAATGVWCDPCIAPIVAALNAAGIATVASCCGHEHRPGSIALRDGRELIIAKDFDEARAIDRIFPIDINGERRAPVEAEAVAWREPNSGETYSTQQLAELLQARDEFIVAKGLWGEFVAGLASYVAPSPTDTGGAEG